MLPLSVQDPKKSDERPNLSSRVIYIIQKRISEVIIVFNSTVVFLLSTWVLTTDFPFRVLLVLLATLSTLLTYWLPSRLPGLKLTQLLVLIPLAVSCISYLALELSTPSSLHRISGSAHVVKTLSTIPQSFSNLSGNPAISVVIPARNEEDDLLIKTIEYLFKETPESLLHEIIIVDDQSDVPIHEMVDRLIANSREKSKVHVIRLDARQGLANAKTIGASSAQASHILFLDGHCRVTPGYAELLMARSLANPNDIIVPHVIDVDAATFDFTAKEGGKKMMFEWNFEFAWFENEASDERVPVASGGLLLMPKAQFMNGKYDRGMLEWGGENIEQSLRAWMCGGRVIVERNAKIGHVFNRKLRPGRVSVAQVHMNQARAAFVWLDDWVRFFEAKHMAGAGFLTDLGPYIDERLELRHRLGCNTFDRFVDEFRPIFDERNLLADSEYTIQDIKTGLCVTGNTTATRGKWREKPVELEWSHCRMYDNLQRFGPASNNTRIRSVRFERCFTVKEKELVLEPCESGGATKPLQTIAFDGNRIRMPADDMCLGSPELEDVAAAVGSRVKLVKCQDTSLGSRKIYLGV